MTITNSSLTKAAGAAAATAGAIFATVQIKHPAFSVQAFTEHATSWHLRSIAKLVMCALALAGLTGMYLHQRRKMGVLGTIGYLVFAAGYLLMSSVESIAAFVLPHLTHSEPGYVNDVLRYSGGLSTAHSIGGLHTLISLVGFLYLGGGLLFGIAIFRADVLYRWAGALLAAGTVATAALHFLPASFDRPMAVPTGVALIGLGVSLWRTQRVHAAETAPVPTTAAVLAHS